MGHSDSSDSDYDRKRKSKKRDRRRSRSSSSDRSRRRSRKSSRDRRRSRSRSRSRDRRRHRSRSRSRERSRRDRRSRSRSRSRDRRSRRYSDEDTKSSSNLKHEKGMVKIGGTDSTDSVNLKDKINALSMKSETTDSLLKYKPSEEELRKYEKDSFVQEHFSKTYNQDNPVQTKSKKKKKKKQQQLQQIKQENELSSTYESKHPSDQTSKISHDDAIFGSTKDTLHLSKFSSSESRIDGKRREELKSLDDDGDLIYGAMFFEKPELRQKRWIEKLQFIRKRLVANGY